LKIQVLLKIFIKLLEQRFIKYKDYTTDDFVSDSCFVEWVNSSGNLNEEKFWQVFLEKHPEKSEEIEMAKAIIKNVDGKKLIRLFYLFNNHNYQTKFKT
jgi:hypothetical protein